MKACPTCGASYEGELALCPMDRTALVLGDDPLVGRLVGGYRLAARIGRGAWATVYRARHELEGGEVALKLMSAAQARSPELRERFLREARATSRIRHPGVVEILDVGTDQDGTVYLAMELLEGETLAGRIALGAMPVCRALRVARDAAAALAHAHALGVVHRDVKPANLFLVSPSDTVKILDFGLARVVGELGLTATGALFGTPAYMPPEQAEGASVGPPADAYALGCVLFEMLTGRPPFVGSTPAVLDQHVTAAPPSARALSPAVSAELDALVGELLGKDAARRPRAAALAERLEALESRASGEG